MAISFQVSEYIDLGRLPAERVPVVALPPLKAKRYSAAGRSDAFQPEARSFRLRNLGGGCWFRVALAAEAGHQAGDNSTSEWLGVGDVVDFMLDHDVQPELWLIDVRAV